MRCTEHRKSSSLFSLSLPSRGFVSSQLRCGMDVYESLNVPVLIVSLYRDGYIRILYVRTTHTAAAARIYNISSRLVTSFTSKEKETTSPSILFLQPILSRTLLLGFFCRRRRDRVAARKKIRKKEKKRILLHATSSSLTIRV